jgi:hypothetical protein
MPLTPGTNQFQVEYVIPADKGSAQITVASPVAVKQLMVFIPDDGTTVAADGIELTGSSDMGNGKTRFYKAVSVPPEKQVKLTISGITDPPAKDASSAPTFGGSTQAAQLFAGAGAVVILLFGVALLFIKGVPKRG